ncbi:MAG: phosphatase domain-containing protein [Kofleriaceae bacterium]
MSISVGAFACTDRSNDDLEDLGDLGDSKADTVLPREVVIDVAPGEAKRIRVKTAAFVARLTQSGDVAAQLTAISLELETASDVTAHPALDIAGDGTVRTWTIRVDNLGDAQLQGTLLVDLPATATAELGIVSDIDKTVMPPETSAGLVPPYPGVAALLATLELRANGVAGDVYYVTARDADRIEGVPEWMAMYGVPAGPIETGVGGEPWIAQPEKVADISRIFDAHPDQKFALLGDTAHRDPEVYGEIRTKYPDQVATIIIHKVNMTVNPNRVVGMNMVTNYAQAAAAALAADLVDEAEARTIMETARSQGLMISDAEIDALIEGAN